MSAAIGKYRAKADCRAGGFFRKAGEVFEMPVIQVLPGHLEEAEAECSAPAGTGAASLAKDKPKTGKPASVPVEARVSKAEIGAGAPTPVQDVTSADMVAR